MMIDSLEMNDAGRAAMVARCRDAAERAIVITHGTDTMVETARALAAAGLAGKTIVLTGAMVPYAFGSSDGLFNLGSALSFVQVLPPGVYVAMNGRHFRWDAVRKNRETGRLRAASLSITCIFTSKLPVVGTTIFTVMSKLAADIGAINLSQGFPDFDCDPALVDAVARHMREGRNQYPPMQGVPALRQAIAAKYAALYGAELRRRHRGHRHLRRHRGDLRRRRCRRPPGRRSDRLRAVLRLATCRRSSSPAASRCVVSLRYPDYAVPWDDVRAAITPRTRMIMLNSPHNPTGDDPGRPTDMQQLAAIVDGTDIIDRQRRGLRAHRVRRRAAREHGAPRRAARAQLHRRLVRQDLSRHRLEDRLRRGAGGVDGGVPQGAPVRDVLVEHADAVRARRLPDRRAAAIPSCRRSTSASATCSSS